MTKIYQKIFFYILCIIQINFMANLVKKYTKLSLPCQTEQIKNNVLLKRYQPLFRETIPGLDDRLQCGPHRKTLSVRLNYSKAYFYSIMSSGICGVRLRMV